MPHPNDRGVGCYSCPFCDNPKGENSFCRNPAPRDDGHDVLSFGRWPVVQPQRDWRGQHPLIGRAVEKWRTARRAAR